MNLLNNPRYNTSLSLKRNYSMLWFLLTMTAHFLNPLLMSGRYIIMQKSPGETRKLQVTKLLRQRDLKGLGHAILGNFSTDEMVIELTKI